jgi:hypothetical protein
LSRPSTSLAPQESKTWMLGTSPGMTEMAVVDGRLHVIASEAKQSIWHPRNERKEWIASSPRSSQ